MALRYTAMLPNITNPIINFPQNHHTTYIHKHEIRSVYACWLKKKKKLINELYTQTPQHAPRKSLK